MSTQSTTARILDGNEVSSAIIAEVRKAIDSRVLAGGRRPGA